MTTSGTAFIVEVKEAGSGSYWNRVYLNRSKARADVEAQALKDQRPVARWKDGGYVLLAYDADQAPLYTIVALEIIS